MWVIFKKLSNDLYKDRFKLFLILLAQLLAIWGISTVMYGHWFTERDFRVNFEASETADMVLYSDGFDDALISELEAWDEIEAIEKRGLMSARIRDDEGEWMPLLLHIVDDFEAVHINRFKPEKLESPTPQTILLEKNGAYFLPSNAKEAEIQIPTLGTFILPIHDYVHDPRLPPSRMEHMVYGYISRTSLEKLFPDYSSGRFLIKTQEILQNRADLQKLADEMTKWFAQRNIQLENINIPPPNIHPHQNIVDALAFLQRLFGGIVALLGVILFSLVLLSWILPQLREIGIMKAIGASTTEIQQAYLLLIFVLSLMGLFPGLFLGYKSGELYNRFIAFTQNFEVVEGGFPILNNLLVIGICLFIPLIVSYRPIMKACRSQSREVMNQVFHPISQQLFQFFQHILPSTQLKYTVNNLLRHGLRFLLSICLLTTGMTLLFMGFHLSHSLKEDTASHLENSRFQFTVYFPKNQAKSSFDIPDKIGVKASYPIRRTSVFPLSNTLHQTFSLKYLPPNFEFSPSSILDGTSERGCQNCIWINQGLLPEFENIALGDSLSFQDSNGDKFVYEFKGIIKELGVAGTLYTYGSDSINANFSEMWLAFEHQSAQEMLEKQQELEHFFEEKSMPLSGIASSAHRLQMIRDHLKPTFITIQAMGIFAIICGLIGLAIMLNIQLTERKGELGLLSAIGGSERRIASMWLNEILILNAISIIISFFISIYGAAKLCALFGDTILHIPILFFPDWGMITLLILIILAGQILLGGPYLLKLIRKNAYQRLNQGVD